MLYSPRNQLFNLGYSKSIPRENLSFHLHAFYEIYFFLEGDVNYFIEDTIYRLKQNDILIMRSDEIHRATFTKTSLYRRYTLHFNPSLIHRFSLGNDHILSMYEKRKKGQHNLIRPDSICLSHLNSLFESLNLAYLEEEKHHEELCFSYIIQILILLSNQFYHSKRTDLPIVKNERLKNIITYINKNIQNDLALDDLCNQFFLSKQHLNRIFKKNIGISVHQYIIHRRMSLAKESLRNGLSVQETYITSGFKDYANFLRTFKKIIGISPGKYKNGIITDT